MSNNNYMKKTNSLGSINAHNNFFKDENITKYMSTKNNGNQIPTLNKPPLFPGVVREFGKDLTNKSILNKNINSNSININQKKYAHPSKLINYLKPVRKEKEEVKRQFIRNDSLYNLRPRNITSINSSRNNSGNNSFSTNNENVNTMNLLNNYNSNSNMTVDGDEMGENIQQKMSKNFYSHDSMQEDGENQISSFNGKINKENMSRNEINIPKENNFFSFKGLNNNQNIVITNNSHVEKNPQQVADYLYDIYDCLKETESVNWPRFGYLKSQPDLNEKMRAILFDWLVDVHLKFKLVPETLFLTTQLIDRFLEKKKLGRTKLQLLGVSSLFIASKYEEIYPPELKDFVYITDKAYDKSDILEMEKDILSTLDFDITHPSPFRFLDLYLELAQTKLDDNLYFFARYLLELFLVEYRMIKYPPSWIAAATLFIAAKVKKQNIHGNKKLDVPKISGYSEDKLKECAREICLILDNADKNSLQAVRNKFSSSKYLEVAKWKKT